MTLKDFGSKDLHEHPDEANNEEVDGRAGGELGGREEEGCGLWPG